MRLSRLDGSSPRLDLVGRAHLLAPEQARSQPENRQRQRRRSARVSRHLPQRRGGEQRYFQDRGSRQSRMVRKNN
jgi:hypothetical protein